MLPINEVAISYVNLHKEKLTNLNNRMESGCHIKDARLKKGVNVRSQNSRKEQLQIFKRWRGGSNGGVVRWLLITINEIKSEWRLFLTRQLQPLHDAFQLHNQQYDKPYNV
jgi:hypothetical protein